MKSYYFLSDLHLRDMNDDQAQTLLRFFISLEAQAKTSVVFLVGDIFDLWIGKHQYFIQKFQPLVDVLRRLVASGLEIHYFEGNHDLHLKKFWQDDLSFIVHSDPEYFSLDGDIVRIEHGDQMDPEDTGYLFLRWLLRTPIMTWIALYLPGFLVAWLGRSMSKTSRAYTNSLRDPQKILKTIHTHAQKAFQERAFQAIITGHVHLRDETSFVINGQKMISFNLGSWDSGCQVLRKHGQSWQWLTL
jgi:UDP-2,3-diacylglucosamine hydrolase